MVFVRSEQNTDALKQVIDVVRATIQEAGNNNNQVDRGFMDAVGLPKGSLQVIMKPIYEIFPEDTFVNYIPLDPTSTGPGVDKLTYPRITYDGTGEMGQVGSNYRRSVDVGFQPVEYPVFEHKVKFTITRSENERLNHAMRQNGIGAAINLFAEKMKAASKDASKIRDELLSRGRPDLGYLGMLSHPDVLTINLDEPFPSPTADDNLNVLSKVVSEISKQTNGAISATSLLLPHNDFVFLQNQPRSGTDMSTLKYFASNQGSVTLEDGTVTPFEIGKSAQLENAYGTGRHGMLGFCRHLDHVAQVIPMNLTPMDFVPTTEGYEVPLDAYFAGAQIKQGYSILNVQYSRT